jgi:hypothetical protein
MKVIVAGSRTINDKNTVWDAINNSKFNITTLISGGAMGVDRIAEEWARSKNIPILVYKPHYDIDNPKYAPLARNTDMARDGDALIAIWKDQTRGTAHMIGCMKKENKPVEIILVK